LNLVVKSLDPGEGGPRGDAIDKDESLTISYPLIPQGSVLLLACGIQDFEHARLMVNDDLFPVRVFNSRIVRFDEMVQTQLGELSVSSDREKIGEGVRTCIVKAVFPTPPSPSTTNLYSVIFPAISVDL